MGKFSRKLVSKVIYIKILRASSPELLDKFLKANGWNLLISWLKIAVNTLNSPLLTELLLVLLVCPPPPTNSQCDENIVVSLIQEVQHQNNSAHCNIIHKVLSNWSFSKNTLPSVKETSPYLTNRTTLSILKLQDSIRSMSPTRRFCSRLVAATSPKKALPVTFQQIPLQEITDTVRCSKLKFTREVYKDFRENKGEDNDEKSLELELTEIDQACKQLISKEKPRSSNHDVDLKAQEKQHSKEKSNSRKLLLKDGMNNNYSVGVGYESSAKEFRLARREQYKQEQRQIELEEEFERKERFEREQERERKKHQKRLKEKELKRRIEQEEKERKVEEETAKRKKMEEEFKKKRDEEVTKKIKEREKKIISFRKSELRNDLDADKKKQIKQVALQLKQQSTTISKSLTSDTKDKKLKLDIAKHSEGSKVKPIVSTAKNKNKDLLDTLTKTADIPKKDIVSKSTKRLSDRVGANINSRKVSSNIENYVKDSDPLFKIPRKRDVSSEHFSRDNEVTKSDFISLSENVETSECNALKEKQESVQTKPSLKLKPASQLKEISLFGTSLDIKGNSKKRKSSFNEYRNKRLKVKGGVGSDFVAPNNAIETSSLQETVTNVFKSREVSGILIIQHGSLPKKKVGWLNDKDLVKIEFFEVDESERVNVNKLKFEDIRQKERKNERAAFTTLRREENLDSIKPEIKSWPMLVLLDSARPSNFLAGGKSRERETQNLREQRVLPFLPLGSIGLDPSEPELPSDRGCSMISKITHVLSEDVSGEGANIDYSNVEWPRQLENEDKGGQMSDSQLRSGTLNGNRDRGLMGEIINRSSVNCAATFGRGSSHSSATTFYGRGSSQSGGFRGRREGLQFRGGFMSHKKIPCKYWIKGTCVVGGNCQFLHEL